MAAVAHRRRSFSPERRFQRLRLLPPAGSPLTRIHADAICCLRHRLMPFSASGRIRQQQALSRTSEVREATDILVSLFEDTEMCCRRQKVWLRLGVDADRLPPRLRVMSR